MGRRPEGGQQYVKAAGQGPQTPPEQKPMLPMGQQSSSDEHAQSLQLQTPPPHRDPPSQTAPQAPQLSLSALVSRHVSPQQRREKFSSVWQSASDAQDSE